MEFGAWFGLWASILVGWNTGDSCWMESSAQIGLWASILVGWNTDDSC